jgi:hypothetical protein
VDFCRSWANLGTIHDDLERRARDSPAAVTRKSLQGISCTIPPVTIFSCEETDEVGLLTERKYESGESYVKRMDYQLHYQVKGARWLARGQAGYNLFIRNFTKLLFNVWFYLPFCSMRCAIFYRNKERPLKIVPKNRLCERRPLIPASKSHTIQAVTFSTLAHGKSIIHHPLGLFRCRQPSGGLGVCSGKSM